MQYGNLRSLQDPLSNCRVKLIAGLHPKAQIGVISNLTGIDSDDEQPELSILKLSSRAPSARLKNLPVRFWQC